MEEDNYWDRQIGKTNKYQVTRSLLNEGDILEQQEK
jgi:hypothetical protein